MIFIVFVFNQVPNEKMLKLFKVPQLRLCHLIFYINLPRLKNMSEKRPFLNYAMVTLNKLDSVKNLPCAFFSQFSTQNIFY